MFHRRKTAKASSDSNLTLGRLIAQHLTLDLPIRGRMYRIACPVNAESMILAAVLAATPATPEGEATPPQFVLDGVTTDSAVEALLGDQFGAMLLNGVPPETVMHAAETTLVWLTHGIDRAVWHWSRWNPDHDSLPFTKTTEET